MDWLKKHFDRVILAVLGVVLIGIAAFFVNELLVFEERFAERDTAKPADNTIPESAVERIDAAGEVLAGPRHWGAHEGSLFISRPYILRDGEIIDPMAGDEALFSGPDGTPIPNSWIQTHDLPYWMPDLLETDPDNDGFSVWEEFLAQSDPTDQESKPGFWTKLRLKEYIRVPFRVRFDGSPDGGETFAINPIDAGGRTQFLKIGDEIMIVDVPYTLKNYEPKSKMVDNIERDISELTLEDEATGETIVLVRGVETDSPSSFGLFVNLMDAEEFEVRLEDGFSLSQEPEVNYKLIDISETDAVIENDETGEKHTVRSLN